MGKQKDKIYTIYIKLCHLHKIPENAKAIYSVREYAGYSLGTRGTGRWGEEKISGIFYVENFINKQYYIECSFGFIGVYIVKNYKTVYLITCSL